MIKLSLSCTPTLIACFTIFIVVLYVSITSAFIALFYKFSPRYSFERIFLKEKLYELLQSNNKNVRLTLRLKSLSVKALPWQNGFGFSIVWFHAAIGAFSRAWTWPTSFEKWTNSGYPLLSAFPKNPKDSAIGLSERLIVPSAARLSRSVCRLSAQLNRW